MRLSDNDLVLRAAERSDEEKLWNLIYGDPEWKEYDAPYYPLEVEDIECFRNGTFARFMAAEDALLIEYRGSIVGSVTSFWEDEATRWLEVGIAIYSSSCWGRGTGKRALRLWIDHLFKVNELARIGLTTWSGNPRMIACAEAIGLKVEGRLRQVRYYSGTYYDSVKMGVLKSEWGGS